jgi:hypothetical protein
MDLAPGSMRAVLVVVHVKILAPAYFPEDGKLLIMIKAMTSIRGEGIYEVHKAGRNEAWRHNRYNNNDFCLVQLRRGKRMCPLLTIPGFTIIQFRDDWLHSVDQGVGADFLGNLFKMIMHKLMALYAMTKQQAANDLWQRILAWYDLHHVQDKLKAFSWNNVQSKNSDPPKLRGCNAASVRALIPFGNVVAQSLLDSTVPIEDAAKQAARHLFLCYQAMSHTTASPLKKELLLNSSISFALQFEACRDLSEDPYFRIKPKMHRFLEMCSDDGIPNLFWTYRDEDFGGTLGHQSKVRGCWHKIGYYNKHALQLFALKNDEPRLLQE